MTETPTLDELVEKAAARHNGASGRRLAEIAHQGGHEVSHATLNRIRRGTYASTPTDQTLHAIAFLAGVDPKVAFAALAAQHEETRATADLYYRWARLQLESRRLAHEYAHMRAIDIDAAERELAEIFEMEEDRRRGRPWTPPWDPGPEYNEGDTPWLRSWWQPEPELADLDDLGPQFAGMKVNQVSLPRWMHNVEEFPGTPGMIQHVLSRHRGARNYVASYDFSGDQPVTVVYLAVDDPSRFDATLAKADLQGYLGGGEQRAVDLVILDEIPTTPNGKADLQRLRDLRQHRAEAQPPEPTFDRSRMLAAMEEPEAAEPPDEPDVDAPSDDFEGR